MGPEQLSSGDEADSHTNVEDEEERKENSPLQKDCGTLYGTNILHCTFILDPL